MEKYDIIVRVKFKGNIVPAELVQELLDNIEDAVYRSEEEDIRRLFNDSSNIQIPGVVKDACLFRFNNHRGNALIIESTEKGSLIIEAVVAGLSYWLIQNTIGETFKEAWKETELHEQIKRFFLSGRVKDDNKKAKDIESNISSRMRRWYSPYRERPYEATVSTHITYEKSTIINVTVEQNKLTKLPPRFSDLIDKNDNQNDSDIHSEG